MATVREVHERWEALGRPEPAPGELVAAIGQVLRDLSPARMVERLTQPTNEAIQQLLAPLQALHLPAPEVPFEACALCQATLGAVRRALEYTHAEGHPEHNEEETSP